MKSFLFEFFFVLAMGDVRDIMVRNVITIDYNKTAKDVALLFAEKEISSLVVIKDGIPIGLVTERDLARKVFLSVTETLRARSRSVTRPIGIPSLMTTRELISFSANKSATSFAVLL